MPAPHRTALHCALQAQLASAEAAQAQAASAAAAAEEQQGKVRMTLVMMMMPAAGATCMHAGTQGIWRKPTVHAIALQACAPAPTHRTMMMVMRLIEILSVRNMSFFPLIWLTRSAAQQLNTCACVCVSCLCPTAGCPATRASRDAGRGGGGDHRPAAAAGAAGGEAPSLLALEHCLSQCVGASCMRCRHVPLWWDAAARGLKRPHVDS